MRYLSIVVLALGCGGSSADEDGGTTGAIDALVSDALVSDGLVADAGPAPVTCQVPAVSGTRYYVTTGGSDSSGTGTESAPWATITHALDNASDDSTILVGPGTYIGRVRLRGTFATGVTVRADPPYQARLRHNATVVTCYTGQGITLEGFDIAHDGAGAGALVIQIQDLIDGADSVSRITLRNNILHDSYNNDILKINNGATQIVVERNIFYNQTGSDEHIDINSVDDVVVQDNVFFNDFAGSGRTNNNDTSSYIVVKDSNGSDDAFTGSQRVRIRRNVFLNWEGNTGTNFVLIGEDGNPYHEAVDVTVENNLMLGLSANPMRAPFGIKGGKDVTFRHNTVVGNMPGAAYAFRFNTEGSNPANQNIQVYNNIWSDWTGTMDDFSDTPTGETSSFTFDNNLFWNGGSPLPSSGDDLINPSDDANKIEADPKLPELATVTTPLWNQGTSLFSDGSGDICAVFEKLVTTYAVPPAGSPAIGAARADQAPSEDILGRTRTTPSVGAAEPQ